MSGVLCIGFRKIAMIAPCCDRGKSDKPREVKDSPDETNNDVIMGKLRNSRLHWNRKRRMIEKIDCRQFQSTFANCIAHGHHLPRTSKQWVTAHEHPQSVGTCQFAADRPTSTLLNTENRRGKSQKPPFGVTYVRQPRYNNAADVYQLPFYLPKLSAAGPAYVSLVHPWFF
jgi:hypothetical protein